MENLRSIKEKIQSCISCNENQCPMIKERLDHHLLSHHSSFKRAVSSQQITPHQKHARLIYSSKSTTSDTKTDKHTSTSDLVDDKETEKVNKPTYNEGLRAIVLECIKNLPTYQNASDTNVEQNKINEFIEKISKLYLDYNDDSYNVKLDFEIDDLLHSLPLIHKHNEIIMGNLKAKMATHIADFNKKIEHNSNNRSRNIKTFKPNKSLKDKNTKTDFIDSFESNKNDANVQYSDINILINSLSDNDDSLLRLNTNNSNPIQKISVDTQIIPFSGTTFHENTKETSNLNKYTHDTRDSRDDLKESNVKKIIMNWLFQLNDEVNLNIAYTDIQTIIEELYNRLLPLLNIDTGRTNKKLLLKENIINFLNEYFNMMSHYNSAQLNKYAENLIILLLIEISNNRKSYSQEQNTYFLNRLENKNGITEEMEKIKNILRETITKTLEKYNLYSVPITEDIVDLLSGNLHWIHRRDDHELEVTLFHLLKSTTDLSNVDTVDIVDSIMDELKNNTLVDILNHNSSAKINTQNKHCFRNIISVFKSEHELLERSSNSSIPIRKRKSSILKKTNSKINPEEQVYTEKLISLIKAWINTLPKQHNKSKYKKFKEILVNNLVEDILDQVKLEQACPETSNEKDKYISFFIYRWLNKYEYFQDINEAKSYVDQLTEKIKDISVPNLIKVQSNKHKAMQNINSSKSVSVPQESLLPREVEILKNEISNWLNDQPSKIFFKKDRSVKSEIIHKFALKIHEYINKCSSEQLTNEIKDWLVEIIKPEQKQNIPGLAENLQSKIEKFFPYKNIENIHRQKESEQKTDSSCCGENITDSRISENNLKQLIAKYLEYKYDSENFIARKTSTQFLKNELKKLCNLYKLDKKSSTSLQQQATTLKNLFKELQYIRIISDWMNEIPLQESSNNTENSVRGLLVISLAKNIREIEDDRQKSFSKAEYNNNITSLINEFTKQLPIPLHFKNSMQAKINDLVSKIAAVKHHSTDAQFTMQNIQTKNSISDQNLTDYIEAFIRENEEEIFEDDLKLEACILRLFKELYSTTNQKPIIDYGTCVFNKSADTSVPSNETIKHFTLEMEYAKEITEWLKNLPLLPLTDKVTQNQLVLMIYNLAEKISGTENDSELKDYVTNWISKLPLDSKKEIVLPVVIQQILNRIKRVNKRNEQQIHHTQKVISKVKDREPSSNICNYPHSCCSKIITQENRDPGTVIVETIEEWCNNLPVQAENETICKSLKENVAIKLYQKLGELNMNPEYFNNNILYEEMLSEEIDIRLQALPQSPKLQKLKNDLKKQLLNIIIEQRNEIKKKSCGIEYKHELEKTIEMSYPIPYHENSPTFKILKDRLATMFILENFDHGNDAVKLNYEKRIKKEIDKYFDEVQLKNSVPLTKDQIYNELYSALYNVPLPNESSMVDEVEEIKTRCEIDNWFETLPLREVTDVGELLERDQILAMLAKRLHEFEKYDKDCDKKMNKEITKWLVRLPLLPPHANNIDYFANNLQQRLKSTLSDRRHIPGTINKSNQLVVDQDKSILNSSSLVESRNSLQLNPPPSLPTCCQAPSIQKSKKPYDMILSFVETWCQQLPLPANTPQEKDNVKVIKDNLVIRIIMKISELNINPETFNDDSLYDALLDDELENLMSKLPVSYEFIESKTARKNQLKEAIKSVKPLIKEEKARYEYRLGIKNTVDKTLRDDFETSFEKSHLFDSLKEEIVDNFIIYNFHKNNQENSWKYKTLLTDAVVKYYTLINADHDVNPQLDPLLKSNQLLCELAKIPTPVENAIFEDIKEIQIKFELTKFFDNLSLKQDDENVVLKNQIKAILAKQLNNLIKAGDMLNNDSKIKENVIKTLRKLDENIDPYKVDIFVKNLKYLALNNAYSSHLPHENVNKQNISTHNERDKSIAEVQQANSNEKTKDEQWLSLLPATPKGHESNYEPKKVGQDEEDIKNPQQQIFDHHFNQSGLDYESFEKGTLLSSSIRKEYDDGGKVNAYGQLITPNQNISDINKTAESSLNTGQTNKRFVQTIIRPKDPDYSTSTLTGSDKPQEYQPIQNEKKNNLKPSKYSIIHRSLDQERIDQANQTKYFQQIQPQRPGVPTSISDSRTLEFPHMHNQFSQQTSSVLSQTPNQGEIPGQEQYHRNSFTQIQADRFSINTQDAHTHETEHVRQSSTQSISDTPSISFQNIREPRPYIPFSFIPSTTYVSQRKPVSHSCVRGQPCRRPSITIFSPTGLSRCDDIEQSSKMTKDELETCECFNRSNMCSVHMRRHCRICNEINPFYCRIPSYRYLSFHYH